MTLKNAQHDKATAFRELHEKGIFVLPNAWDAGSAALIAAAGAPVIATTSAGVSWALGRPDGQGLTRTEMVAAVERMVAAVEVPVTADIEGGYGPGPKDVAATVEAVLAVGAVGVNLEDSLDRGGPLYDSATQAERLRAARSAAERAGLPEFVLNARTDVFLFEIGDPDGRLENVLTRASAYAAAGADCLFVPGLVDLDTLTTLTRESPLPINVMARSARRCTRWPAVPPARYSPSAPTPRWMRPIPSEPSTVHSTGLDLVEPQPRLAERAAPGGRRGWVEDECQPLAGWGLGRLRGCAVGGRGRWPGCGRRVWWSSCGGQAVARCPLGQGPTIPVSTRRGIRLCPADRYDVDTVKYYFDHQG